MFNESQGYDGYTEYSIEEFVLQKISEKVVNSPIISDQFYSMGVGFEPRL